MEFVDLKGGLTLPVDVLEFALMLEERGLRLQADGDVLRVSAAAGVKLELSATDSAFIRSRKAHLLAVASYTPPAEIVDPGGT